MAEYHVRTAPKKAADRIMMNARSTGRTGQRLTRSTTSTTWTRKRTHAHRSVRGIRHLLQSRTSTGDEMEELIIFLLGIFIGASLGVFLMALAIASRDDDEDMR